MNEIIQYIIQFLLGDHVPKEVSKKIGYTSDEKEYSKYKLVIKPSDFLMMVFMVQKQVYLHYR